MIKNPFKQTLSPFSLLNLVQFLAAINENLYKLLAAYFLIHELGKNHTNSIMANVGIVFILPFLIFSSLGGFFADRFPKNQVTIVTRFLEFMCLLIGIYFFWSQIWWGAYFILFLMASISAIFGPTKYGLIPELIAPQNLLYANSVIAAFTYLGIIIGTTLASATIEEAGNQFFIALLVSTSIAFAGLFISFFLPSTPAGNQYKRFHFFIYMELWEALKQMWVIPNLFSALFAYSYFLFLGAYLQLNIIPYTVTILNMNETEGGYFFLLTAFGLGLGAYFTHSICRDEIKLNLIPLSGVGISMIMFLMYWFYTPWWFIIIWMLLLGFLGGMFLVPPQAFLQAASPEESRGRNFATANFFSFAFALLASFALAFLNTFLGLSPATSFTVIALLNLIAMAPLLKKWVFNS